MAGMPPKSPQFTPTRAARPNALRPGARHPAEAPPIGPCSPSLSRHWEPGAGRRAPSGRGVAAGLGGG